MKITSVQTFLVRSPLTHHRSNSHTIFRFRDTLLVKIGTDEGVVGWGETAPLAGARSLIENEFRALLIGKNPLEHRHLWRQLWGNNFGNGCAVGAVDIALHDLRGKALNLSIAELYGGRLRDRVPAYATSLGYFEGIPPERSYPDEALAIVQSGFGALKLRIGGLPVRRDLAVVENVRQTVGPDIKLMVDINGAYTLPTAIQVGHELERLGVYWYEEPLPQPHYVGYDVLTDQLDIAVAAGECLDSRLAFQDVLARRAMDIVQPDVSLCGGFAECLFVAEMSRLYGILAAPHCYNGGIIIAATLQLLSLLAPASWARETYVPMLELDISENPFRDDLVPNLPKIREGEVDIPTGPGLGIEIDENVIKHYALD